MISTKYKIGEHLWCVREGKLNPCVLIGYEWTEKFSKDSLCAAVLVTYEVELANGSKLNNPLHLSNNAEETIRMAKEAFLANLLLELYKVANPGNLSFYTNDPKGSMLDLRRHYEDPN